MLSKASGSKSKRKTSKPKAAATPTTSIVNHFDTLVIEDSGDEEMQVSQTNEAANVSKQIESYRTKQKRDFQKMKKNERKPQEPSKLSKRTRKEDTCNRRFYDKTY